MYFVTKIFHFDAAHRLYNYKGKCYNLHGHTWKVEVTLASMGLNKSDMVVDFGVIEEEVGKLLDETFDHGVVLNKKDPLTYTLKARPEMKVVEFDGDPTSEVIARDIHEKILDIFGDSIPTFFVLESVKVWESPTANAVYAGGRAK